MYKLRIMAKLISFASNTLMLGMVLAWSVIGAECSFANFGEHASHCELVEKEISFLTTEPVEVKCSYPVFSGHGILIEHVNQQLKAETEARFDSFVQEEIFSSEELEEGCTLCYDLAPVYQTSELISVFGCRTVCRDCRGCSYYEGKNFWEHENSVVQLALDDLFVVGSEYRPFLLKHCEDYFKAAGYGYYSLRKEFPPELTTDDLDIFTLTDKGLLITFPAYQVGGWADGPDQVLIPYVKLREYIDPFGPLGKLSE
jgi:hypothetical protein